MANEFWRAERPTDSSLANKIRNLAQSAPRPANWTQMQSQSQPVIAEQRLVAEPGILQQIAEFLESKGYGSGERHVPEPIPNPLPKPGPMPMPPKPRPGPPVAVSVTVPTFYEHTTVRRRLDLVEQYLDIKGNGQPLTTILDTLSKEIGDLQARVQRLEGMYTGTIEETYEIDDEADHVVEPPDEEEDLVVQEQVIAKKEAMHPRHGRQRTRT